MKWSDRIALWNKLHESVAKSESVDVITIRFSDLECAICRVVGIEADPRAEEPVTHISALRQEVHEMQKLCANRVDDIRDLKAELKTTRTQLADLHVRHQELHGNYEARTEIISGLKAALRNTEAELLKAEAKAALPHHLKDGPAYQRIEELEAELAVLGAAAKNSCRLGNYMIEQIPGTAGVTVWHIGLGT